MYPLIIIFIFIIIIIVSSLFVIYFIFFIRNKSILRSSTIIFYFNLKNKSFKLLKSKKFNFFLPFYTKLNTLKYTKKFFSISKLSKLFNNAIIMKKIRSIYYEFLDENIDYKKIKLPWKYMNKQLTIILEFNRIDQYSGVGSFTWKTKNEITHLLPVNKSFKGFAYKNKNYSYTNMYAIRLINNKNDNFALMIAEEIYDNLNATINFVQSRGVLYFTISSKYKWQLQKNNLLLISLFKQKAKMNYLNDISFVSYIPINKENIKLSELIKIQKKLDYALYEMHSMRTRNDGLIHCSLFDDVYSKDNFQKFTIAFSKFDEMLKTNNIRSYSLKIINTNTKTISGLFLVPNIRDFMNKKEVEMGYTKWIKHKFIDVLVSKINLSDKVTPNNRRGSIVQVNYDWLMNNYIKIINKNYLYCILINSVTHLKKCLPIFEYFSKNAKIKYGIKINRNFSIDKNLLKKANLSFIVISKNFSLNIYKREEFSKILLINKVFEDIKLKIIYINPSPQLDDMQFSELKIQYAIFDK